MKFLRFLMYTFHSFFEHDCANRAAALAYTTLLSIVPLVMVTFWILSWFPALAGTGEILQDFIVKNFVAHSAQVVSEQLNHFLERTKVLSWSSLFALAIVAILMIYDMVGAFNSIWKIKMKRHLALSFSFYSMVLLLAPIFFGIFMVFTSYLATLPFVAGIIFLEKPISHLLPYGVAFLVFTFLNWVLPHCTVPFRYAVLAGFITTVLFETVKYFFGLYMSYFPTYQLIYGTLATIPIFLLWIYVSWVIILLGALICQIMTRGIPKNL
jgi:membrane protein